ncbi:Hypothetical protein A7982_09223 [Minicystis rosea]|nr:Hypothetical protein A7982_09223 [Minicystis rosea]
MPITGKLEVTIKIHELPTEVTTDKNGWKHFRIECSGRPVDVALRPRMWNKLEEAKANYPLWVAAITGTMGQPVGHGFVLDEPALQVFERKPRPPAAEPPPTSPST